MIEANNSSSGHQSLRWRKLGLKFNPQTFWPDLTFAQVPFTRVENELVRVFFSTRRPKSAEGLYSAEMRWVDFDATAFPEGSPMGWAASPLMPQGKPGTFDDHGTMGGSVVDIMGEPHLYFSGWSLGVAVPYAWAIGLAKLSPDLTRATRVYAGPILGALKGEPYLQASPIVFATASGFKMLYLTGYDWIEAEGRQESLYHIVTADSPDGVNWVRNGVPIVPKRHELECQTSPTILEISSGYVMYFSYRDGVGFRGSGPGTYKIGMAVSKDMETWERLPDPSDLIPTPESWDSEMVCYPHIFKVGDQIFMLYCGNAFGREGFGVAQLAEGRETVIRVVA